MYRNRSYRPLPIRFGRLMAVAAAATLIALAFQSVGDAGQFRHDPVDMTQTDDNREFSIHDTGWKSKTEAERLR